MDFLCDNLVLVGPQGSGKTSVGKGLAEKLDLLFLDLDKLFLDIYGLEAGDYMRKYGPWGFRKRESKLLADTLDCDGGPIVLATGGGVAYPTGMGLSQKLVDEYALSNSQVLKSDSNKVFYLRPGDDFDEFTQICFDRVQKDNNNAQRIPFGGIDGFRKMVQERDYHYDDSSDRVINSKGNVQELVDLIIPEYRILSN